MLRVYVHLTTGEKLRSFEARDFDIDLGKQGEGGLRKYTYTGPEDEEATIYLNPRGVAAIETRSIKERPGQGPEGPAGGRNRLLSGRDPQRGGKRDLLQIEDD